MSGVIPSGEHALRQQYDASTRTLIGTARKNLIDADTGECITVDQVTKMVYGTKNFWKCYLMDFLAVLGVFDSKQVDVFIYIVENTNQSNNTFLGTYKKIAADVGCSETTIAKIVKKLVEHNFIKKLQNGAWLVNPNVLMKGGDRKRQILLSYYESEEPISQVTMSRTKRKPIPLEDGGQLGGQLDGQMALTADGEIVEEVVSNEVVADE